MTSVNRRRFIAISAAAALAPKGAWAAPVAHWRGTALGAAATLQISGVEQGDADPIFDRLTGEIDRLENIFSLYRSNSALSRLNATGRLAHPAPELLEILSLSAALHRSTNGAFDPSIQPLWRAYAKALGQPGAQAIYDARALTGWEGVGFDTGSVRFSRRGMALTLNGIAQGYVADRVSDLMRREGLENVLVDMGEVRAMGQRPGGGPWRAGIVAPAAGHLLSRVELGDRALATSAPTGTQFGAKGPEGHILDPRSAKPGDTWGLVSVSASRAAVADGLSTAFCLMGQAEIKASLRVFEDARLEYLSTKEEIA